MRKLSRVRYDMKTFIAYRFTGVPLTELEPFLRQIVDAFRSRGIDAYCSLFDEQMFRSESFTGRDIFDHTFAILEASDFLFVVQLTNDKSEGMLMEVGYSVAKNIPIIVAQHESVTATYVHELAQTSFRFSSTSELCAHIARMQIPKS